MLRSLRSPLLHLQQVVHYPVMFSGGLLILSFVFVLMLYSQTVERMKMFFKALASLLKSRQAMTPKIKVAHLDKTQAEELKKVFDV